MQALIFFSGLAGLIALVWLLALISEDIEQQFTRAANRKQGNYNRQTNSALLYWVRRLICFYREPERPISDQNEEDQKRKLDADMVLWTRAVARYTKALVLVGIIGAAIAFGTLLAIKGQLDEMHSSGGQTDQIIAANKKLAEAAIKSADAARQSADSTIALERPYFFVSVRTNESIAKSGPFDSVATPILQFTIHNVGRVPGILRTMYVRCYLQRGEFPELLIAESSQFRMAQNAIGAGLASAEIPCQFEKPFSKQDWLDIVANHAVPVFTTILIYEGPLDYTYVDTVSYRIDPFDGGSAYPLGLKNYADEQASEGRVSKGATLDLPNILWKPQVPFPSK